MRRVELASLLVPLVGCMIGEETAPPRVAPLAVAPIMEVAAAAPSANAEIPLLQVHHMDRPTEVIAIFDIHAEMGHENDALAELRARAAAVGAQAVLGVEFHHGEGGNEPTHLSGIAVRFIELQGGE